MKREKAGMRHKKNSADSDNLFFLKPKSPFSASRKVQPVKAFKKRLKNISSSRFYI